jgi:putative Mg2+ transporter-C (MgtC) family protein
MDVISAPESMWIVSGRLVLATALGAAVGYDRELLQKPAGVRTLALVALGSALVALMSVLLTHPSFGEDLAAPSRIIQGLVAGVGFIGGGVILRLESEQRVEGLTTAASIWVVAAVGIGVGLGLWRTAIVAVVLALVVLLLGRPMAAKAKDPHPRA